jgi:hypothetical protein
MTNPEEDLYLEEVNDDAWDAEHACAEKGIAEEIVPKPPKYSDPALETAMERLFGSFGLR